MATTSERLSHTYFLLGKLQRQLHELIRDGKDESDEGEALRDTMDEPWYAMSDFERDLSRGLGADLNALLPDCPARPVTISHQEFSTQFAEAQAHGDWVTALDLLRTNAHFVEPAYLSYLRGIFWARLEDFESALVFFENAVQQKEPKPEYAYTLIFTYLVLGQFNRATSRILSIAGARPDLLPDPIVAGAQEHVQIEAELDVLDCNSDDARRNRLEADRLLCLELQQAVLELLRGQNDGRLPFATDETRSSEGLIRFAA